MKKGQDGFEIIESENGVVDVEYTCNRHICQHLASLTWCEDNCQLYYSCQMVADANDYLVENGY